MLQHETVVQKPEPLDLSAGKDGGCSASGAGPLYGQAPTCGMPTAEKAAQMPAAHVVAQLGAGPTMGLDIDMLTWLITRLLIIAAGMGASKSLNFFGDSEEAVEAAPKVSKRDAKANQADGFGWTSLHFTAGQGAVQSASDLLERGADVAARDGLEDTPLHAAARAGQVEACMLLLKHKADIEAKNDMDQTPLLVAAHAGHKAVCKALLAEGATIEVADEAVPPILQSLLLAKMFENALPCDDAVEDDADSSDFE